MPVMRWVKDTGENEDAILVVASKCGRFHVGCAMEDLPPSAFWKVVLFCEEDVVLQGRGSERAGEGDMHRWGFSYFKGLVGLFCEDSCFCRYFR